MLDWSICLLGAICCVASILSAWMVIPIIKRKAVSWNILDFPNDRKTHQSPTPRMGGLSLMPGLWVASCASLLFLYNAGLSVESEPLVGLLLGSSAFFGLGFLDDLKGMRATSKLFVQMAIAALVVNFLPLPSIVFGVEVPGAMLWLSFWAWLVILPNSVNLLDGVDGLTGILGSCFAAFASLLFFTRGEFAWAIVCLGLLGALVGFLRFNWNPAKIFLGDCGSLMIGFFIAFASLRLASSTGSSASAIEFSPMILVLLTSVWLGDTAWAIFRRYKTNAPSLKLSRRCLKTYLHFHGGAFRSVVRPDRGHIHHKLLEQGYSVKQTSSLIGLAGAVGMTLSLSFFNHLQAVKGSTIQYEAFLGSMLFLSIAFIIHYGPAIKRQADLTASKSLSSSANARHSKKSSAEQKKAA